VRFFVRRSTTHQIAPLLQAGAVYVSFYFMDRAYCFSPWRFFISTKCALNWFITLMV
jgi:hypothetical protein